MLIGVAAVVLGGFIIICAAPFASHRLYKAGGSFFLASGETDGNVTEPGGNLPRWKWFNPVVEMCLT